MAKTTRTNPASRGGLTLVEDEVLDESYEAAPSRRPSRNSSAEAPVSADASPRLRPFHPEEENPDEPFLRRRRRVPVRRGVLPGWSRTRWGRILFIALVLAVFAAGITLAFAVRNFFLRNGQFRVTSANSIQIVGNVEVNRDAILSAFDPDLGHSIFLVPLARRRAELESLPWVQSAAVMRILPDHLRVSIVERKPVAFLRTGSTISLIDAQGVVLALTPAVMSRHHFNFPVVTGLDAGMPQAERATRMQLYLNFMHALNGSGHFTSQIGEINLADPEDVQAGVTVNGRDLLLHFGHEDFLARYQRYASHIGNWLAQYPALSAVDLRYNDQVVLTMAHSVSSQAGNAAKSAQPAPARHATRAAHHATRSRR